MAYKKPQGFLIYLLFLFSGISGLIYEVIWVRIFGNFFGNTIYSAAIVTSVFMLGLGIGSYFAGIWSDNRYKKGKALEFFRTYGYAELAIAILGLTIALASPVLKGFSGSFARYSTGAHGWQYLSLVSHLGQFLFAIVLMLPVTTLMGATLTILIRQLVAEDVQAAGWRIGVLYGFNTAGAALGCFATDLFLVPKLGLLHTQLAAVLINTAVGLAAILLTRKRSGLGSQFVLCPSPVGEDGPAKPPLPRGLVRSMALALFFSGFSFMGMEIVWFRFLSGSLGGYRVVFSLLLTVILVGIWLGSLAGGYTVKRWGKPLERYMLVQVVFICVTPLLLVAFNGSAAEAFFLKRILGLPADVGLSRLSQIWGIARPILAVIGLPSFLIGFSFPLANAYVQRLEQSVGRRAGGLYLANTLGAVLGAISAGFILLPNLGSQLSVLVFCFVSSLVILFLQVSKRQEPSTAPWRSKHGLFIICLIICCGTLVSWSLLPANYLTMKSFPFVSTGQRIITSGEGLNEMLMVIENPGGERFLLTNGHSMSGTTLKLQRYMRAFVHIPLLQMDSPRSVLVICFGVGNTLHAASLHPTIQSLDVVDLSEQILNHAPYFRDSNRDVLEDKRVSVFINDGRLHLQMMPPAHYDLITLEPPPIAFAGVSSLYSREFYELARSRLKSGGFVTQWLPLYQVPPETGLSMIRAFLDVFPNAVLLSGMQKELILMGRAGPDAPIDPDLCSIHISKAPLVQADLKRINMGTLTEMIGTFVANHDDLRRATLAVEAVTDDNRSMEYGMISKFTDASLPPELIRVDGIAAWCPGCFANGKPRSSVISLDKYLAALNILYRSPAFLFFRRIWGPMSGSDIDFIDPDGSLGTVVSRSPYLNEVLASPLSGSLKQIVRRSPDGPWSIQGVSEKFYADAATNIRIAMKLLRSDRLADASRWFKRAVELEHGHVSARFGLGYALFYSGNYRGALEQYQRGIELAPDNIEARLSLATVFHMLDRLPDEREELMRILSMDAEFSRAAARLGRI
ncbi:MAG: tetratricopeptide repeat protein [Chrysiogenia bacterium]